MAGRPRKPSHLKLIAGTDRRDRADPEIASEAPPSNATAQGPVPSPPKWLPNAAAKAEWRRLAPGLAASGALNELTSSLFGQMCALHGALAAAWRTDAGPSAHLLNRYLALQKSFGLAPSDRPPPG